MGPADSHRITRVPRYSGYHMHQKMFVYGAFTRYGRTFQFFPLHFQNASAWSYNPHKALPQCGFGLFPVRSPLLGESFLFSLPRGTKMFQFPRFASPHNGDNGIKPLGCPIRKSTGQRIFAPHRGLSQLITSFIASVSQGIHHAPLTTFFRLCNYPKHCQ